MSAGGRQNWSWQATRFGILVAAALVFPVAGYAGRIIGPSSTLTTLSANPKGMQAGTSEAVSADGTVLVVGAPNTTVSGQTGAGAVYVFTEPSGGWGTIPTPYPVTVFTASSPVANAHLGASVAISADGSTIVAGVPGQGMAYVFSEPQFQGWSSESSANQDTVLTGTSAAQFGASVAVYGNNNNGATIVVGAPNTTGTGANGAAVTDAGAAYVYSYSFTSGASAPATLPVTKTTATGTTISPTLSAGEYFGSSVAIDSYGTAIIVGAPGPTPAVSKVTKQPLIQGAAYVFAYTPAGVSQTGSPAYKVQILDPGNALGDLFGTSVAINSATTTGLAETAAIGAPGTASSQGAVYLYTAPAGGGGNWTTSPASTLTAFRATNNSYLGESVAVSSDGSTIVAGAPGAPSASSGSYSQGTVFQFDQPSRGPNLQQWSSEASATQSETYEYTKSSTTSSGNNIGGSAAVFDPAGSNAWVFAGAPNIPVKDSNGNVVSTGTIYVFNGK